MKIILIIIHRISFQCCMSNYSLYQCIYFLYFLHTKMNCLIPPKSFTVNNQNSRQLLRFNAHWCTLKRYQFRCFQLRNAKNRNWFPIYKKVFKLKHLKDQRNFRVPNWNVKKLPLVMKEVHNSQSQLLLWSEFPTGILKEFHSHFLDNDPRVEVEITKYKTQKNENEGRYGTCFGSFPVEILEKFWMNSKAILFLWLENFKILSFHKIPIDFFFWYPKLKLHKQT